MSCAGAKLFLGTNFKRAINIYSMQNVERMITVEQEAMDLNYLMFNSMVHLYGSIL